MATSINCSRTGGQRHEFFITHQSRGSAGQIGSLRRTVNAGKGGSRTGLKTEQLANWCDELDLHIVIGVIERDGGTLYCTTLKSVVGVEMAEKVQSQDRLF
jgi:hypothetical protein